MADDRAIVATTPLGAELLFAFMTGTEEISTCFDFDVGLASLLATISADKMLGQPITIKVGTGGEPRFFNGLVSEFQFLRIADGYAHYQVKIRPWLWFLSLRTDCRIFQNLSVVEIVEQVFSAHGGKVEKRLQGSYDPRDYCVQFDESDLDFVQRLLEHEGIFYFFEHEDGAHTLILTDTNSKLKPVSGYESVMFQVDSGVGARARDFINDWKPKASVLPGSYSHTDYDFEKPSADLMAKSEQPLKGELAKGEQYHHPGAHLDVSRGDKVATIRREEIQAPQVRIKAAGNARGLGPGCTFKLEDFPREVENDEFIVLSAEYGLWDPQYRTGMERKGDGYEVKLIVAPKAIAYRPDRKTRRPIMRGPQTAVVVGPAGQEIFTDKYARVKVQFHWDRLGKRDQNTTCFVRVSSVWAGAGWGFIQIPRIGQEVIVDFIEGDPDKPIITGRVYNASQMPPYALPANATQSGWKSNSSLGGGGFNELRFEDKKGSEEVYFQAEKDHNELVKNDEGRLIQHDMQERVDNNSNQSIGVNRTEDVGNDKTTKVGHDRSVSIGNNDTETVGVDRSLTVGSNETISVGSNSTETIAIAHTQTVGAAQAITVGASRADTVGASEVRTVGVNQTQTVGSNRAVTVGSNQSHTIGANDATEIGAKQSLKIASDQGTEIGGLQSLKVAKDQSSEIGGAQSTKVGKDALHDIAGSMGVKSGKSIMIEATDDITIKVGSAAITMKKDGTINIEGKDITLKASGKLNGKADSEITFKGSKINNN